MNRSELNVILTNNTHTVNPRPNSASSSGSHSQIPVPRFNCSPKVQERINSLRPASGQHQQDGNGSSEKSMSVAAQRAAFERLDAKAAAAASPSNLTRVSVSRELGSSPQLQQSMSDCRSSRQDLSNSSQEARWKCKFEEAEKRRKALLHKSEAGNRENAELERKYQYLLKQNGTMQAQLQDKEEKLEKMRIVSEAVCKEYELLKRQYDVETGAMHKAMQQASEWYRQNRELKRRSQVITQKFLQSNPDAFNDIKLEDEVDNHGDDIEQLRETVSELSQEIAKLQTELSAARLQEFEAQEQVTLLTAQLEEEKMSRENENAEMTEMKTQKENMERITKMIADEVLTLKTQCDREKENARIVKMEADRIQKERNILAHQSALLMTDIGDDPSGRLFVVLQEVESLKRLLEEEKQSHTAQIQLLQEKLEEKESNIEFEIVEEKLKLAESELKLVEQRAERSEKRAEALQELVRELEAKLAEIEQKMKAPPPPPPPPPPPMPPAPFKFNNEKSCVKLSVQKNNNMRRNSLELSTVENELGITKKSPSITQPAIDDIINQIKGGKFTLKQTDKIREEKKRKQDETKPPAVLEMLNILGTMRRRTKPTRNSFKFSNESS